jgi:hypothetical protein
MNIALAITNCGTSFSIGNSPELPQEAADLDRRDRLRAFARLGPRPIVAALEIRQDLAGEQHA